MSRILKQAKTQYKTAFLLEFLAFIIFFVGMALWQWQLAIDFSFGFLSAFLPFGLFVYIVFFRQYLQTEKLKAVYIGEACKFGLTVLLLVMVFKFVAINKIIMFFIGFFVALALNNFIPLLVNKLTKTKD